MKYNQSLSLKKPQPDNGSHSIGCVSLKRIVTLNRTCVAISVSNKEAPTQAAHASTSLYFLLLLVWQFSLK